MGLNVGTLFATLGLDDAPFAAGLAGLEGTVTAFGTKLSAIGKSMTVGLTVPIIAGLGMATKSAADFQQAMLLIQTQAGASADEVKAMTDAILAMGGKVEQTPEELAKGLYWIESAGYRGAAALDILKASSDLAAVGQTDLAESAHSVSSIMLTMPDQFKTAADAAAWMNAVVGNGQMRMEELNAAMGTGFMSVAETFGVSAQSLGSSLDYLTARHIPAQDAATKLKMAMTLLAAPTSKAKEILDGLGISETEVTGATQHASEMFAKAGITQSQLAEDMQKPNGLQAAILDLKQHLIDSGVSAIAANDMIAKAFGGGRTGTAIMAMANDTAGLQQTFDAVGASVNNFGADVDAQSKTAKANWEKFKSSFMTDLIILGNIALPKVTDELQKMGSAVQTAGDKFATLNPHMQTMIVQGGLIAAALGPLVWIGSKIAATVSGLVTVFRVLGSAVAGLSGISGALETIAIAAMYVWDAFAGSAVVTSILEGLVTVVLAVAEAFAVPIEAAVAIVVAIVVAVIAVIAGIIYWLTHFDEVNHAVAAAVGAVWEYLGGVFGSVWETIKGFFSSTLGAVSNFVSQAPGKLKAVGAAIVNAIVGELKRLPYQIGFVIGYALGTIVRLLFVAARDAFNAGRAIVNAIVGAISALPGIVSGIFWAVVNTIISAISTALQWIVTNISRIPGIFMSGLAAIPGIASGAFWAVVNLVSGAMSGLLGAINDGISWAVGAVSALPGQLMSAIGDLGGLLVDAGHQLIQGLINGIGDMAGAAKDAITGLAGGLKDGFLHAIGSHSPSRVFAAAAEWIPHGVAQGVMNATPVAVSAIKNMASSLSQPIQGPGLGLAAAGAAGLANNNSYDQRSDNRRYNIVLPNVTDHKSFMKAIEKDERLNG